MTRVYMGGRHYPPWAPRVLWHRLTHWLVGPLLGCSCSGPGPSGNRMWNRPSLLAAEDGSCFYSPWRVEYPARMRYADRVRLARLEDAVRGAGIEVKR